MMSTVITQGPLPNGQPARLASQCRAGLHVNAGLLPCGQLTWLMILSGGCKRLMPLVTLTQSFASWVEASPGVAGKSRPL
jgi:hypothetical protein